MADLKSLAMTVRHLRVNDIPEAMELSAEAGWNQTPQDWRALIEWDPGACLAIDIEGDLAATATLVCYGSRLGWIGMVLTRGSYRRRGCARMLVEKAIETADMQGVDTLKLDATSAGEPLYSSLGFRAEQPVERWLKEGFADGTGNSRRGEISSALDLKAFGADRTMMIESLAARGNVTGSDSAFAMTRAGRVAHYLGPCIAHDETAAEKAIAWALNDCESPSYWDLLPINAKAVAIATKLGFAPVRRLTRMSRGKTLRGQDQMVFAIGGFEIG